MAFEDLLERVGGTGLFQVLHILTLLLPSILVPSLLLGENFLATTPAHRCWVPLLDNGSEASGNLTPAALLVVSIPPGPNQGPHQCLRFRQPQWQLLEPNATANWSAAATEPCLDGWVYDRSTFASTIVAEWDLVCDSRGLKFVSQSVYMAGILAGSITWGLLSHRFGRRPILSWSCLQMAVANTSTIYALNFLTYCCLRFLSASGLAGILLTVNTLLVEWISARRRDGAVMLLRCTLSLGQMTLGGLAFALRDWRTLQLAVTVPFFAVFLLSWWLPESARWLIIMDKPDQALRELQKVARLNGQKEAKNTLTIEVLRSSMQEEVASARAQGAVLDLFCVPLLRKRLCSLLVVMWDAQRLLAFPTCVLSQLAAAEALVPASSLLLCCFLVTLTTPGSTVVYTECSSAPGRPGGARRRGGSFSLMFSYYGLVLDLQSLGANMFLLQVLFGAVDFLGWATLAFFLRFFRVRMALAAFQAASGLSILANVLVPPDLQVLRVGFAVLGKGCFGISLSFFNLYRPTLFPTPLRMTSDGLIMSMSQLGGAVAPLVRMTQQTLSLLPPLFYGIVPVASSFLLFFLPDTQGLPLPDSIQDLESRGSAAAAKDSQQNGVLTESTWL